MSTPNLSSPSLSNKAEAAAFGFVVSGGIVFVLGDGDGFICFGLGVMVVFALAAKLVCHGLNALLLLFSVFDDDGE